MYKIPLFLKTLSTARQLTAHLANHVPQSGH